MNSRIDEINDGLDWCGIQVVGAERLAECLAAARDPAAELTELALTGRRQGIEFRSAAVRDHALLARDLERSLRISPTQAVTIAQNVRGPQQ